MALILTGPGGLFTRLGHLIYAVTDIVNGYRGVDLPNRTNLIQADYSTSDQNLIDSLYSQLTGFQSAPASAASYYRSLAQNTVTQMVAESAPQLASANYQQALNYLVKYMNDNSESVVRNTVSTVLTVGSSNAGNGVVLCSSYNNFGLIQEQIFNETISIAVTRDYQSGATVGQETLLFAGFSGTNDRLSWLWPQGSNAALNIQAVTPAIGNSGTTKNWLVNGMMEGFTTTNVPDGWHVQTGTPGTTIFKDTGVYYDGVSSVKFLGNGTEHTAIWTQFGVDFNSKAVKLDQLAANLWFKTTSVPTTGVLTIAITDGSGTALLDGSGNPSSFNIDLTTVSYINWHSLGGFLRFPETLPSSVYLMISLSTPLQVGVSVNIDRVALARPPLFYLGGPSLIGFSGNDPWLIGDTFSIACNNAYNGLVQSGCDRLLGLSSSGLILPSTTGTPTISDGVVV